MLKTEDTLVVLVDFQVRLLPSIANHEELEEVAATFIRGCRVLGLPILVLQQYTKGLGETTDKLKDALGSFEPIEKVIFSGYPVAEFKRQLTESGRKNIVVAGIEAHVCVQQTVLDLLADGYNVYVLADCIGSRKDSDKMYSEKRMSAQGAVITTMESVLFELLGAADHPKRKEITNLVK